MAFTSKTQLFASVLLCLLSYAVAHSYMTNPISRTNQGQTQTGCRGPACLGPCDTPLKNALRAPVVAARGTAINVQWPRNNHAGGFIRFAWAPTSQSDSHAAFDAHVQQINCHEVGDDTPGHCAPSDPVNDINGGGSGPGDGSSGACNIDITIPLDLTDGKWTLQWAWFGGAFALGDYYSCTDYNIVGGPTGTLTPRFVGGDFSYPGQNKCKFFNTNELHVCIDEPCNAPIFPASQAQSGLPAIGQLGNVTVAPTPVAPTPVAPITSGKVAPVAPITSGKVAPITSGKVAPITSGMAAPKPMTTGAKSSTTAMAASVPVPVTVPVTSASVPAPVTSAAVAVPVPTPSSSGNCAGASTLSSSVARIDSVDSWGPQFHMLVIINVQEAILSDWVLEITWPSSMTATKVTRFFNAGVLTCEGTLTSYFSPVASWSNNVPAGSNIQVELIASNTNNQDGNFIMSNTQLRVLKK